MGYCIVCGKIDSDRVVPNGWYVVIDPRTNLHHCTELRTNGTTKAMCVCPTCLVKHGTLESVAADRINYKPKNTPVEKVKEKENGKTRFDYIAEFNGLTPVSESKKEPVVKIKKKRGRPKKVKP